MVVGQATDALPIISKGGNEMINEEINQLIAKWCGVANLFVIKKRGLYYRPHAKGYTSNIAEAWKVTEETADKHTYPHDEPVTKHRIPPTDFCNDLNAIHKAEKLLKGEQQKRLYVARLVSLMKPGEFTVMAPARQRAEALLKTIGKWKD